ncbi:MAG: hypothetical protein WC792_03395 [Candidatus Micrarchaeia archaeon]
MKLEAKSKESMVLAGLLWAMLVFALLSPSAMQLFHAAIRLATEGNSYAKSALFVAFLAFCLSLKGFLGSPEYGGKNVRTAFFAAAGISMAYGLLLQLAFLGMLGSDVNSFVSHVTECGGSWCWEGDYLQHNHVSKTAIFFLEKYAGISLGGQVDNGQPMYEIVPWADLAAPLTLLLTAAIACFGFLSVLREKTGLNALLLGMAVSLFTIASIDGGIFTQTGISAVTLLAIYLWRERKSALAEEKFAAPLAIGAFAGFVPNLFLGSIMYYRDWFPGMIVVAAFFASIGAERGWKKITLMAVLLFSSLFFASHVYDKAYGAQATIYRTTSFVEGFPGAPNLVIYGLPEGVPKGEVEALIPEINFTSSAKYGWYFVGAAGASSPIKLSRLQLQERLRNAYPGGYLYVEENDRAYVFRQAYVVWNTRPQNSPDYGALYSMKVLKAEDRGAYTVLSGIAAAGGPALGLEVGSYIKSIGGDATVITGIV